jgi:plastocyanin
MRLHPRYLWLLAVLSCGAGILPSVANSATTATVEAISPSFYTPYWLPEEVAVTTATGTVTFVNNSSGVPHGIVWKSTPAAPVCEEGANQVPVNTWKTNWKGGCTFPSEGVYKYYCAYHGEAMSGTIYVNAKGVIPPPPPVATTGEATALTETGATLNGTINPHEQPTSYYFNYGKTISYGEKTEELAVGEDNAPHAVAAPIVGLIPGTPYHFQLVATYGAGKTTTLGLDRTFTTVSPPGAPTALTNAATVVSETEATLKGAVNPNGQASEYFFEWGIETGYGQTTAVLAAGEDHISHPVSATLTGLVPGTVYHFRLIAKNASGPSPGLDREFKTTSPPEKEPPPPSPPPPTPTPPPTTAPLVTPPAHEEGFKLGPALLAGSAKLTALRHASAVRGSIEVGQVGAGGRLEVDLATKSAFIAKTRGSGAKRVRVGRLVRQSVPAGKLTFAVSLTAQGKRALAHRHSLPLTVTITLTPTQSSASTITRTLTLHT